MGVSNAPYDRPRTDIVVARDRNSDLPEVLGALSAARRLSRLLHGGEKQARKNSENCDDNEKLDEGQPLPRPSRCLAGAASACARPSGDRQAKRT